MTSTRSTLWLDWSLADFGLETRARCILSFACLRNEVLPYRHQPENIMRADALEIAVCICCHRVLLRPSTAAPRGMLYRWAAWQYLIEEEP